MKRAVPATGALVGATAVWGSTFAVTKDSLDQLPPSSLLVWRFGLAALALGLVRPRSVLRLTATGWRHAAVLGFALSAGFLLQTTGLRETPAGVSGFLTGAAVVLTPLVAALCFRDPVGRAGWAAVAMSAVGITGLAGGSSVPSLTGAVLTLGGAACFAVHIAGLGRWSSRQDAYALTAGSVAVAAVVCIGAATARGAVVVPATARSWASVLYLSLFATCLGFLVQAWAQSVLSVTAAAVTMTLEPVFAALIAQALGERPLHPLGWVCGVLVVAAMTVAELGPRRCCDALSPTVGCC